MEYEEATDNMNASMPRFESRSYLELIRDGFVSLDKRNVFMRRGDEVYCMRGLIFEQKEIRYGLFVGSEADLEESIRETCGGWAI